MSCTSELGGTATAAAAVPMEQMLVESTPQLKRTVTIPSSSGNKSRHLFDRHDKAERRGSGNDGNRRGETRTEY